MTDEIIPTQAPVAPAPTAAAPVAIPSVDTTVTAPAAVVAPVAPVVEAPAATAPVPAAIAPTTILGAEPPKTDAKTDAKVEAPVADKPADTKAEAPKTEDAKKDASADVKPADQKKEEAKQSDEPAPLPTYEAFKLPEGISADEMRLGEFTKLLAEAELAKGDHTKMQDFGQKLVDRHIAEVQEVLKKQSDFFINAFEKQKVEWKEKFLSDPEIGGNRWQTTATAANEFISTHGGNAEQQKELRQLMESSGIGNHPAMIRVFAKAMMNMSEGKPLPAPKPESRPMSKVERRYGKTTT